MGKSKYQVKAIKSINQQSKRQGPHYYDENIKKRKNSGLALFAIFIVAIAGTVIITGSVLNNRADDLSNQANINPNYVANTGNEVDNTVPSNGYKTPLSITTLSGETISLADHAGKVVVLYFHFLACTYCQYHSPALQAASTQFGSDQLLIIAISVGAADTPDALTNWASSNGYNFKLAKDTDYSLSTQFGAQYTPHTVYLAPDGDASEQHTGAQTESEIALTIQNLLN